MTTSSDLPQRRDVTELSTRRNTAAFLPARHAHPEVAAAPYTSPGADQLVVRTRAVAVNPVDWIIQGAGNLAYNWLDYPAVLGFDVAGDVVEVGSSVTRFAVGDRVLGLAVGTDKDVNSPAQGAFQRYPVVLERLTSPIPDALAYEQAAVLPLAVSTAASGLFQTDLLGLNHPTADPTPTGETVLVWGGSTSVGANAVQLAAAAGYDVIATASPRNSEMVRSLGASQVFDHNGQDVLAEITTVMRQHNVAGAIGFGATSARACVEIIGGCHGRKFVAIGSPPFSFQHFADATNRRIETLRTVPRIARAMASLRMLARRRGVKIKSIVGTTLKDNDVCHAIYRDFLPAALAEQRYIPAPTARVIGAGLEHLQSALDVQRGGVSAEKLVLTMREDRA